MKEFVASNVIKQLEEIKDMMKNTEVQKFYNWLLLNGKSFEGRELSEEEKAILRRLLTSTLFKPKHCFYNSQMIVLNGNNGFTYFEGYAHTVKLGINFEHAWLVKDGKVFDPTWTDATEYFGISIESSFIRNAILKSKTALPLLSAYVHTQLEETTG